MAPGGIRPQAAKRVVAQEPSQDLGHGITTRSKKTLAATVLGTCCQVEGEPSIQRGPACTTEEVDVGHNECPNQTTGAEVIEANMPLANLNDPTSNLDNQNEETQGVNNSEEECEVQWVRGANIGRGLDRLSRSKKGKVPLIIEEGRTRPRSPMIAAKFATECNIAIRNHVPIFPRWKDYKDKDLIFKDFREKVGLKFDTDITKAPYQRACVTMMKKGIRQQRFKLKKKYFDPFPLHLVPTTSPIPHMTDEQWGDLVNSWKEHKKLETCQGNRANRGKVQLHQTTGSRSYDIYIETLGDKCNDEPPNALELFKECHYSKKRKAFTPAVQSVINEIERKITDPTEDGEQPNVTEAVSAVLVRKTKKNRFLHNVGIQNKTGTSNAMRRELEAELIREKQGSNELRALVDKQRQQMDAMAKQMQEAEAARAKHDEEMKQKQAETDALLKRLISMIPNNT